MNIKPIPPWNAIHTYDEAKRELEENGFVHLFTAWGIRIEIQSLEQLDAWKDRLRLVDIC